MSKIAIPHHLESDYDRVMKKPHFEAPRWVVIMILVFMIAIGLGLATALVKGTWKVLTVPELTVNPYREVVKVRETDGTVFTPSDRHFNQRVLEIKKAGRYDTVYTGRLDGKP